MSDLEKKLAQAAEKAETQKAERRARTVKGAHLLPQINELVAQSGLATKDKTGFTQIQGASKGRKVYVAKKGGRVDLSGFTVESSAVTQITEADAKQKHLGKVRGQINFDASDADVIAAVQAALATLAEVVPEPVKEAKPRVKKAKSAEAVVETQPTA